MHFSQILREATRNMRSDGATPEECYQAYADAIGDSYQNVHDAAKIKNTRPSRKICKAIGVVEVSCLVEEIRKVNVQKFFYMDDKSYETDNS